VIHAVDPAEPKGFDADILILGSGVGVDHIDNVRRILSAYLESAYGYSSRDGATIARFVTVYNAVYRGKLDVFNKRYKTVVTKNLTAQAVGLSTNYADWPGNTQIVIPLSDPRLAGTLSTVDTSALTTKDVTSRIKEDGKEGIDTRKDMVDLKERESAQAQERAETAQKEATKTKAEASEKKAEATKAQAEATSARKEAEVKKAEADKNPRDEALRAEAQKAESVAEAKEERAAETKAEAEQAQAIVEEQAAAAEADQKLADTKQKEATSERKEIASDVQDLQNKADQEAKDAASKALAMATPAIALRVMDDTAFLSEIVMVNLADGTVLRSSPVNTIRNRALIDANGPFMAVAGRKSGSGAVRLVLIDATTLEVSKQGSDPVAEQSVLVKNGNDYYAVVEVEGGFAIGRFDANLELKAKSTAKVLPYTAITPTSSGVIVQREGKAMTLLRATDLAELSLVR
jgi:hypothetical protein